MPFLAVPSGHARRAALLAVAVLALLGPAGCGSASTADTDPATIAPASSLAFAEVVVRPEGQAGDDAEALLHRVLARDPGAALQRLAASTIDRTDWRWSEIEPWLGRTMAVAVTGAPRAGGDADAVLILSARDPDDAQDALAAAGEREGGGGRAREREYRGVSYLADPDGTAAAVVGGFAVLGTDRGLRSVIDAEEGDEDRALATSPAYRGATAALSGGDDRLMTAYVDTPRLTTLLRQAGGGANAALLEGLREGAARAPVAAGAVVEGRTARLEVAGPASAGPAPDRTAADVVAGQPADAWLAAGVPALGRQLQQALARFAAAAPGAPETLEGAVRDATGLDVERDLLGWVGDVGVFGIGRSILDFGGGVRIASTTPTGAARFVARLEALARGLQRRARAAGTPEAVQVDAVAGGFQLRTPQLPLPLGVTSQRGGVTIGIGAAPAPATRLQGTPLYRQAAAALGGGVRPSFLLELGPALAALRASGLTAGAPGPERTLRTLDRLGIVAAGSSRRRDTLLQRLAIEVP
ncbi:MAG TPA: DUF3352 domain-containing protein [Solirubrobacteraceae bacterium]|nr:DUF3352 domain-containing protein [Solirubrobacteraceae bacterium]